MNRLVRCQKSILLPAGSLLPVLTAILGVAALWPASAYALQVNVNLDSNTSRTDLVGPADGNGQTWNQINAKNASGLLDSAGGSTAIGFTLNNGSSPLTFSGLSLSMLVASYDLTLPALGTNGFVRLKVTRPN